MADEPTGSAATPPPASDPPGTPPPTPPPPDPDPDPDEPTDVEALKVALRKANREAADHRRTAAKLRADRQADEDAKKSELQRATERADAAERERDALQVAVLRAKVAAEVELPAELHDRIVGDDEAAMRRDAKRLADLFRPAGNLGGGRGGHVPGPSADDMNARIRAAAGRA